MFAVPAYAGTARVAVVPELGSLVSAPFASLSLAAVPLQLAPAALTPVFNLSAPSLSVPVLAAVPAASGVEVNIDGVVYRSALKWDPKDPHSPQRKEGHEGYVYRVDGEPSWDGRELVIKVIKPTVNNPQRELRSLELLSGTDIPHAKLIAASHDGRVMVKEFVRGQTLEEISTKRALSSEEVKGLADYWSRLIKSGLRTDIFPGNIIWDHGRKTWALIDVGGVGKGAALSALELFVKEVLLPSYQKSGKSLGVDPVEFFSALREHLPELWTTVYQRLSRDPILKPLLPSPPQADARLQAAGRFISEQMNALGRPLLNPPFGKRFLTVAQKQALAARHKGRVQEAEHSETALIRGMSYAEYQELWQKGTLTVPDFDVDKALDAPGDPLDPTTDKGMLFKFFASRIRTDVAQHYAAGAAKPGAPGVVVEIGPGAEVVGIRDMDPYLGPGEFEYALVAIPKGVTVKVIGFVFAAGGTKNVGGFEKKLFHVVEELLPPGNTRVPGKVVVQENKFVRLK